MAKILRNSCTTVKALLSPPSLLSPSPLIQNSRIYKFFRLFSYTTLHVNFSMIWDKNWVESVYLSRKIVCWIRKIWNKGTEKLLDFVNKPPSLISPPLY